MCFDGFNFPESVASSKYRYMALICSDPWFSFAHLDIQNPRNEISLNIKLEVAAVKEMIGRIKKPFLLVKQRTKNVTYQ